MHKPWVDKNWTWTDFQGVIVHDGEWSFTLKIDDVLDYQWSCEGESQFFGSRNRQTGTLLSYKTHILQDMVIIPQ